MAKSAKDLAWLAADTVVIWLAWHLAAGLWAWVSGIIGRAG